MAALLTNLGISIHAPREGGDGMNMGKLLVACISIHAPREGGDIHIFEISIVPYISIHAPREGGDGLVCFLKIFL